MSRLSALVVFYSAVDSAVKECVPTVKSHKCSPPWFDKEIRKALKLKNIKHKLMKVYNTDFHTDDLRTARRNFKHLCWAKRTAYIEKLSTQLQRNPKRFWSWMKSNYKQSPAPSVVTLGNRHAFTSYSKASLFNEYFCSVFRRDSTYTFTFSVYSPWTCVILASGVGAATRDGRCPLLLSARMVSISYKQ